MATLDDITALIRKYNPDASEKDVNDTLMNLSPDSNLSIQDKPIPSSSFDVKTSDNTITQNGAIPTPNIDPSFKMSGGPPSLTDIPNPTTSAPVTPPSSPVVAPVASSPSKAVPPVKTPDITSAITTPSYNDNAAREAELARLEHQKKMNIIPSLVGGLGDAAAKGLSAFGMKVPSDTQNQIIERGKETEDTGKKDFELKLQNDPNSDVSKSYRQMVLQIAPTLAKQPNFQSMTAKDIGDKLPLIDTMMKAQAAKDAKELGLKQVAASKESTLGLKESQQQDRLEQQAMQRVASLRGDQSLARIETQRDGAISAYTLLQQAKNEKRPLSQAEYYDLLGQLWKARSGSAPTAEAMRDLDSKTLKGDINKAATYFTGKPAGATTEAVLNNLQQFTKHTGDLMDTQHEAYMAPHLVKPTGLAEERWNPIKTTARGISFSDAVKNAAPKINPGIKGDPMGIL